MNIFVFGGTGFIGQQVCKDLEKHKFDFVVVRIFSDILYESNQKSFNELKTEIQSKKLNSVKAPNIIINLAHAQPYRFGKSASTNRFITEKIVSFGRTLGNCTILHATSEAQYLSGKKMIGLEDTYLAEKRESLKILQKSGLRVSELSISSVISNSYNSKSGIDAKLKTYINSKSPYLFVPDIYIRIETSEEISSKVIYFLKTFQSDLPERILSNAPVFPLQQLVKLLVPQKRVFKIGMSFLFLISFLGSSLIFLTQFYTILNYERISYYKKLVPFHCKNKSIGRIRFIHDYFS